METKDVSTSVGIFTLKEPNAGQRNRALIMAETDNGFKSTIFIFNLLPKCVVKRPVEVDQTVPIDHLLDSLNTTDYDKLASELKGMISNLVEGMTEAEHEEKKA